MAIGEGHSLQRKSDIQRATELRTMAQNIAGSLYDIHLTGAREDAFRAPMKLYGRLSALASDIGGHGIDFKPTDQQRDVYEIFNKRLENVNEKFKKFLNTEVERLNRQLQKSEFQILLDKGIKN